MSQRRKSGLQRGLSEIVARQTAVAAEKARQSADLISRFAEPKFIPAHGTSPQAPAEAPSPRRGRPRPAGAEVERLPGADAPPQSPAERLAEIVREERGYYPTFNDISDRLVPELRLDAYEQVVLYRMYRLSRGWQRETCVVGHSKLADATNLSRSTVQKTVAKLLERGLIEYLGDGGNDGTEYRVLPGVPIPSHGIPPHGIPSQSTGIPSHGTRRSHGIPCDGHIKNNIRNLKKNIKKGVVRLAPEEIQFLVATVADLLGEGEPIEEVEGRLAPTMHAVDWAAIKSTALAQAAQRRRTKRPTG